MLAWSAFSAPGTRYGSLNQDSYLCVSKGASEEKTPLQKDSREGQTTQHNTKGEEAFLFAVFDGHSILGEEASNCAKNSFEKSFHERFQLSSSRELEKDLNSMFQQAHQDILKIYENPPERAHYATHGRDKSFVLAENKAVYQGKGDEDIKPIEFGCTAASVIILPDEIWVGWVGDSRVLICYEDSKHSSTLNCFYATVDHNTKNEHEVTRLEGEQIEGELRPDGYVEIHTDYGMIQNLAMTRALGHVKFAEKGGVICTPELRKMKRKAIKYIVIMSDGVCNILKKAELLDICTKAEPREASKIIVSKAIEKASLLGRSAADNSTAIVIHFQ